MTTTFDVPFDCLTALRAYYGDDSLALFLYERAVRDGALTCSVCGGFFANDTYSIGDECPNGCAADPTDYYYDVDNNLASYLTSLA